MVQGARGLLGTCVWGTWGQRGIFTPEKALLFQKDDQSLQKALGKGWLRYLWCLEGSKVISGGKGWDRLSSCLF